MMKLLSSHDQARALHHFDCIDEKPVPAMIANAKQRACLAMFFQMMLAGSATIYSGDEAGLSGLRGFLRSS
jgi:cyclomaltodextrinase